jgi:hypothetical protein
MEPSLRTREDPDNPPGYPARDSTARTEHLTWSQQSLLMRKWISIIGVLLCVFVTVLFIRQHAIPEAIAFGVIGLMSLGYLAWTLAVKARRHR